MWSLRWKELWCSRHSARAGPPAPAGSRRTGSLRGSLSLGSRGPRAALPAPPAKLQFPAPKRMGSSVAGPPCGQDPGAARSSQLVQGDLSSWVSRQREAQPQGRAPGCPRGAQSDLGGPWQEAVQGEPPGGSGKSGDRGIGVVSEEAWLRQAVRRVTFTST